MMTREKSLWPNKEKTPNQKMEEEHEGSTWEGIDSYSCQSMFCLMWGLFCSICRLGWFLTWKSCGCGPHAALARLGRNSTHLAEAIWASLTPEGTGTLPLNGGEKEALPENDSSQLPPEREKYSSGATCFFSLIIGGNSLVNKLGS